ncbi:MAG: hypothetical protein IPM60_05460 [Rhodospirillales bacterium]|nr:hypothetical protein [Rhodospirillales bacterium]
MRDFWLRSGFHLLDRSGNGRLVVTDDFLRAYFCRPEIRPIETSCATERAVFADLMEDPRLPVPDARLKSFGDQDTAENYRMLLAFRDRLLRHGTLEGFYLDFVRHPQSTILPLFVDQVVQAILRGMLHDCDDPLRLRAAELFFRIQCVTIDSGAILMADEETIEMRAAHGESGAGDALVAATAPPSRVELDVLNADNAASYWERSDRFDMVFDAGMARFGQDALARVLEIWVQHFLGVAVAIQPAASIRDERWRWHVGLDSQASAVLDDLYQGREVDEARMYRLLGLFQLRFKDRRTVSPEMDGRPVYLAMAMTEDHRFRLKPQNLLVNLPLVAAV